MNLRFQFTLRGLMLATFWAAVSTAGWVYYLERPDGRLTLPAFLAYLLGWIGAFGSLGALFSRTGAGVSAGLLFGTLVYGIFLQ